MLADDFVPLLISTYNIAEPAKEYKYCNGMNWIQYFSVKYFIVYN